MKRFAELFSALDSSTASNAKLAALTAYFRAAEPADAAWAVYFLAGGKPRQLVPAKLLRQVAQQAAGLPEWLFEECYEAVGDLAETISLVLPPAAGGEAAPDTGLATLMRTQLLPLRGLSPDSIAPRLHTLWAGLDTIERLVATKLITGNLRIGVSRLLVTRALAAVAGVDAKQIAQRLVASTGTGRLPSAADHLALLAPLAEGTGDGPAERGGTPYPFFLAHALPRALDEAGSALPPDVEGLLGPVEGWLAEWKWDGIRAQAVKRDGQWWLWSRGEELVSEQFPELAGLAPHLPDGTVLDGEVLAWQQGQPQPFAVLQQRLGRKRLSPAVLQQWPVVFMAYDLLEWQGEDQRAQPQHVRRARLEAWVAQAQAAAAETGEHLPLALSPLVDGADWAALAAWRGEARAR
ncbi:MAG TPA: ATP-dependent DNA ligase, partial [Ideonella sp.]|nr:ATP-dependent DNA ligase [Ideonella sp.]